MSVCFGLLFLSIFVGCLVCCIAYAFVHNNELRLLPIGELLTNIR